MPSANKQQPQNGYCVGATRVKRPSKRLVSKKQQPLRGYCLHSSALRASEMRKKLEIFDKNFFQIVPSVSISVICGGQHISIIEIDILLSFCVSTSFGVRDISKFVIFHTFNNVAITS